MASNKMIGRGTPSIQRSIPRPMSFLLPIIYELFIRVNQSCATVRGYFSKIRRQPRVNDVGRFLPRSPERIKIRALLLHRGIGHRGLLRNQPTRDPAPGIK
jgi:hypothetical protein